MLKSAIDNGKPLFSFQDWHDFLKIQDQHADYEIDTMSSSRLLDESADDLTDDLVKKYRIEVPVINEQEPDIETRETEIDVSQDKSRIVISRNRSSNVTGTSVKVTFQFSGNPSIFNIKPTSFSLNPPCATVKGNRLILTITGIGLTCEKAYPEIKKRIAEINSNLNQHRLTSKAFNDTLPARIHDRIEQRQKKLRADQSLQAKLKSAFQSDNA